MSAAAVPSSSSTRATASPTARAAVTSTTIEASASDSRRSKPATAQPRSRSAPVVAAPIPLAAPVTIATSVVIDVGRRLHRVQRAALDVLGRPGALGDLEARAEPDVAGGEDGLDQRPQRLDAAGTAAEERVAGEQEQRAVAAHRPDLADPHLGDARRRLDDAPDVGARQERILLPVV